MKPSNLPNISPTSQTFQHISLTNLLWLSVKPVTQFLTKPIKRLYYRQQANHYAMCASHETTLSQHHAQNAIHYARAQALATAKANSL